VKIRAPHVGDDKEKGKETNGKVCTKSQVGYISAIYGADPTRLESWDWKVWWFVGI